MTLWNGFEVVLCARCNCLVVLDGSTTHDDFHEKVEAALSAAQGYNLDGTPN